MLPCRLREFSPERQNLCETRTQKLEAVVLHLKVQNSKSLSQVGFLLSRYGVAFGPFGSRRSWTISGDWNLLLVSLQLTPLHGSERPLAKRAVFESRFVPIWLSFRAASAARNLLLGFCRKA